MNEKQKRQRRKSRTLIGAVLAFFGINAYEKETGAVGCTPLSIIVATTIGVIAVGIVIGSVAHVIPPFNQTANGNRVTNLTANTRITHALSPTTATSNGITASFSGDLNGPLIATSFNSCGANSGDYKVDVNGTIDGTQYDVVIEMANYSGPGNYATNTQSNGISGVVVRPVVPSDGWNSLGQPGQITVNSGEKSGTLSVSLISAGEFQPATQITGNWICI